MSGGAPRLRLTIRGRLTVTYGALVAVAVATMVALLYVVMRYGPSYSAELTHPTVSCTMTASREPGPQRSAGSASPGQGGGDGARPSGRTPGPSASASASATQPRDGTVRDAPPPRTSASAASGGPATGTSAAQSVCRPQNGLVSIDVSSRDDFLRALLLFSVAVGAILLVVALGVGWFVARRMLAPLQRITTTAQGIADSTLHERIGLAGPQDEIKELADTFDAMLVRLERAFQAQRRFAANASHELRTPLASMRTILQVALASPEPDDLRAAGAQLLILNERSTGITEALLTLARADHGAITRQPVDLARTAGELCAQVRPAAREAGVRIEGPAGGADVTGDPILLRQLAANLVDNAVRHNRPGGTVSVTVTRSGDGWVRLTVRNSGPVLDQDAVDRAFEPFHRLDTRTHGAAGRPAGYGLGLAIVHAIVRAHDGVLTAVPIRPDGLEVSVGLPERAAHRPHRPGGHDDRVS